MQELGEKIARLLIKEDINENVQFLSQFWCDRAEMWMENSVQDSVPVC